MAFEHDGQGRLRAEVGRLRKHTRELEDRLFEEDRRSFGVSAGTCGDSDSRLRDSERRYRLLAENSLDVIWRMNLDLIFTYVSPAVQTVLGYTPAEFIGTRLADHCDPADLNKMTAAVLHTLENLEENNHIVFETRIKDQDGSFVPVEIHGRVLMDQDGSPLGLQGAARDITERKQQERQQRELRAQLEQSQKMEAVGRLAGGVAHDFNNLLSVILGYSDLVLMDLESANPHREAIQEVADAAMRARGLTRQLLTFSRKQVLAVQTLDANRVINGFEKLLRRIIGEDIRLKLDLSDSAAMVNADPAQLEQVLMNLAVNARDAMPEGGVLTIATRVKDRCPDPEPAGSACDSPDAEQVTISVSDTGIGMDSKTRDHLFEPFFTTKPGDRGTGIGLATVYGIIKQHQGSISVHSRPGFGTTFNIRLPYKSEICEPPAPVAVVSEKAPGTAGILVVEDDRAVRHLACSILVKNGYAVLEAADGPQAVALAHGTDSPIDLLLADVVMPDMKGPEIYEKLVVHHPGAKVLYMSGYPDAIITRQGVLMPGVHLLQKPFTVKNLLEKVRQVLGGLQPSQG